MDWHCVYMYRTIGTFLLNVIMFNGGPLTNISCKPLLEPDLWHWAHSEVPEYPAISGKVNKSDQYISSSVVLHNHCNFLILIVSAEYWCCYLALSVHPPVWWWPLVASLFPHPAETDRLYPMGTHWGETMGARTCLQTSPRCYLSNSILFIHVTVLIACF